MKKLELGDKVKCTRRYVRTKEGFHRKWIARTVHPVTGIVIGKRTLSDGHIDYDKEYRPAHYKTAYLVAFSMHRNPVLIPEGFVFKTSTK